MTTLHLEGVADGPVTMRVGGSEPFTFEVADGSCDVPPEHAKAVLATFGGSAVPALDPLAGPTNPNPYAPPEEPLA